MRARTDGRCPFRIWPTGGRRRLPSRRVRPPRVACAFFHQTRSPNGGADNQSRGYENRVLHDVLTFERKAEREMCEHSFREKKYRSESARHLQEEQQDRKPERTPGQEADADRDFPQAQERQEQLAWQKRNRCANETFGRTEPRHELESAEPDEDDAQGEAEHRDPVIGHPSGDHWVGSIEADPDS